CWACSQAGTARSGSLLPWAVRPERLGPGVRAGHDLRPAFGPQPLDVAAGRGRVELEKVGVDAVGVAPVGHRFLFRGMEAYDGDLLGAGVVLALAFHGLVLRRECCG